MCGNMSVSCFCAYRIHLRSEENPRRCWAAAGAQQFSVSHGRFSSRDPGAGPAQAGQDMIIQIDVKCGQDGGQVSFQGLTPAVFD